MPPSKTINAKKTDASPTTEPLPDSLPDQSERKSIASFTTATKSAKRKTPGKTRTTVVVNTPNLEEKLEADVGEAAEAGNVSDIGADGKELKAMEMDEPVVVKVCELGEKGKNMEDLWLIMKIVRER